LSLWSNLAGASPGWRRWTWHFWSDALCRAGSDLRLVGLWAEEASFRIRDRLDDERCRVDVTRRDRDRHVVVATHGNPVSVWSTDRQKRLAHTPIVISVSDRRFMRTGHAPVAGSAEPEREGGVGETVGGLPVRVGLDPRRKRIAGDGELARLVRVD